MLNGSPGLYINIYYLPMPITIYYIQTTLFPSVSINFIDKYRQVRTYIGNSFDYVEYR